MITATEQPTLHTGITGNKYIVCTQLDQLHNLCTQIGKSVNSIRWVDKYSAYCVRLKSRKHKKAAKQLLDR